MNTDANVLFIGGSVGEVKRRGQSKKFQQIPLLCRSYANRYLPSPMHPLLK